jgi:hypothetical protein
MNSKLLAVRLASLIVVIMLAAVIDVFMFRMPLISWTFCPIALLLTVGFMLFRRRLFPRAITILIAIPITTAVLGAAHDRLIMSAVDRWGQELRGRETQANVTDRPQQFSYHGYRIWLMKDASTAGVIYFEKFDQIRQTYSISTGEFGEAVDAS